MLEKSFILFADLSLYNCGRIVLILISLIRDRAVRPVWEYIIFLYYFICTRKKKFFKQKWIMIIIVGSCQQKGGKFLMIHGYLGIVIRTPTWLQKILIEPIKSSRIWSDINLLDWEKSGIIKLIVF